MSLHRKRAATKNRGAAANLDRARTLFKRCQGSISPRTLNPNDNIPEDLILNKTAVRTSNLEFCLTRNKNIVLAPNSSNRLPGIKSKLKKNMQSK
jgi:hypothetical protein